MYLMGGHAAGPGYLWFRAPLQVFFLAWILVFGLALNGGGGRPE